MTPKSFIISGQIVTFKYDTKELKEWIILGNIGGNVGMILVRMDYENNTKTFNGYGTIENPINKRFTFVMKNWDVMDGPMPTPEEIINPKPSPYISMGMFIPDPENPGKFRTL